MTTIEKPLKDKLILLIEHDSFLAKYIEGNLKVAGAQIVGPARTAQEANALIVRLREPPHAVLISSLILETEGSSIGDALELLGAPLLLIANTRPSYGADAATILFSVFDYDQRNVADDANREFRIIKKKIKKALLVP